ncbi:MAG: SMI1/KNR4 family protein [Colwellia sp.]|nr:SMI1/KNR4 family protein [Colwellia sp.]
MISKDKDWNKEVGATEDEMDELKRSVSFSLPDEYLDLLRFSNGGEGPLLVQPWHFVLDNVSDVLEPSIRSNYEEFFPGYFVFGGNGGGELVAIEIETEKVVSIDGTNTDLKESVMPISDTFPEFLEMVGVEGDVA